MRWEIPTPHEVLEVPTPPGAPTLLRRHGNPQGERLLFCHGTGLAIDAYYPFWSQFEADHDLFIYDLRNHGWNEVSSPTNHNMPTFARDLDNILGTMAMRFGDKPVIGIFHSLSAFVALLTCSDFIRSALRLKYPGFFGLVLFDPPVHKPGTSFEQFDRGVELLAHKILQRPECYDSEEQLVRQFESMPTHANLVPGARELLAHTTLKFVPEETVFRLRCPRICEARIASFIRTLCLETDWASLPCPVKVIGADPLARYSYLPTLDLADMLHMDYDFVPETTHLLQIEKPRECAVIARAFMGGL